MSQAFREDESKSGSSIDLQSPWAEAVDRALDELDSSRDGLSNEEAGRRLESYGPNRLRRVERRSIWSILWEQVKSLIVLLLVVAAVVSFLTGQTVEGLAITAVVLINTAIGFMVEWRAVRSMEALQKIGTVNARVIRDRETKELDAEKLVPGDILQLREGDVLPADVRLIEANGLEIDESALTGESVPVAKQVEPVDRQTKLADRSCMGYKGTAVTRGDALGLIVATGMETELGSISSMVEMAGDVDTPLEKKLNALGRRLVYLTLAVAALVTATGVMAGRAASQIRVRRHWG